jgi:hypothetical protein
MGLHVRESGPGAVRERTGFAKVAHADLNPAKRLGVRVRSTALEGNSVRWMTRIYPHPQAEAVD